MQLVSQGTGPPPKYHLQQLFNLPTFKEDAKHDI